MNKAQLPRGLYVIDTDQHEPSGEHLAFDMGTMKPPHPDCAQSGHRNNCLLFFSKYPAETGEGFKTPKMVGWGRTSGATIKKNPTRQDVEKLLKEEMAYKRERDAFAAIARKKSSNIDKSIVQLNNEINNLYEQYLLPLDVPAANVLQPTEKREAMDTVGPVGNPPEKYDPWKGAKEKAKAASGYHGHSPRWWDLSSSEEEEDAGQIKRRKRKSKCKKNKPCRKPRRKTCRKTCRKACQKACRKTWRKRKKKRHKKSSKK